MRDNTVIIRGYGDSGDAMICTFYKRAKATDAVLVIENYLETQPESARECYRFEVRTADDRRPLYIYRDGKITNKYRGKFKRMKLKRKVRLKAFVHMRETDYIGCIYEAVEYEENARLHMDTILRMKIKELKSREIYFMVCSEDGMEVLYLYNLDGVFASKQHSTQQD